MIDPLFYPLPVQDNKECPTKGILRIDNEYANYRIITEDALIHILGNDVIKIHNYVKVGATV